MNDELIIILIPCWAIIMIVLILSFIKSKKERELKALKYEWTWILKKLKISKIRKIHHSWTENRSSYTEFWLEAEDNEWNIYRSKSYRDLKDGWRTEKEMIKIHNSKEYDLTKKETAIKELTEEINIIESELNNDPWIFKKLKLKYELTILNSYLRLAEEWLITPYIIINNNKITEWDIVDIYVNPDNIKQYYFDLDFAKEKWFYEENNKTTKDVIHTSLDEIISKID